MSLWSVVKPTLARPGRGANSSVDELPGALSSHSFRGLRIPPCPLFVAGEQSDRAKEGDAEQRAGKTAGARTWGLHMCTGGTAYAAFRTWYLLTPRGVCVQCLLAATERHKAFANSLRQGQRATNATRGAWKRKEKYDDKTVTCD